MHYDLTTLPNGLRIISEDMPSLHSLSVGAWVGTGSRDEQPAEAGASHFLEHLLFKGSDAWPARRISDAFDAIGAHHNAFTSKEYTCFWARMRDAHLELGVEVLGEMVQRPAFRQEEIDLERGVVLEEINMNEDDPTDVAHEQFITALWGGHPLAPPILGTPDSITTMSRDTIRTYWSRRYSPKSMVIAAAGRIDHDHLVEVVDGAFGAWEGEEIGRTLSTPEPSASVAVRHRDTEQAHLILGGPSIARDDERRYPLFVADHVVGGGMSSRLFHEIREMRGLAYAVHAFRLPFTDAGANAIYVGTTPTQTSEVLKLIRGELDKFMESGISDEELAQAKGHIQGSLALSLEDPDSRMNRLGRDEITGLDHRSVDEIVEKVDAVTGQDVIGIARTAYGGPYVIGAAGPFEAAELEEFVR